MAMQTLRLGAMRELEKNLNRGFLTSHSFQMKFNDENGTLVEIVFSDRPTFSFALLHPRSATNDGSSWKTTESPGRHFISSESYDHPQFGQAFSAVYAWVDRIAEEILLEAAMKKTDSNLLDELRSRITQTADNLTDPDTPFTEEELDGWSAQLQRLLDRLKELEEQSEIQRGRVDQLSRELENLKKQGTTIPKRIWLKTAGNKILDLLDSASKATLNALAEGAVKALLEHK